MREQLREKIAGEITLSADAGKTIRKWREEFGISGLPETDPVRLLNPITEDHTCLRAYLMPSLMRILRRNKHRDLPQRIFEVGTVVRDGRRSERLCMMSTASKVPFTEMKSVTEAVMRELAPEHSVETCDYPVFVPGRGANLSVDGRYVGIFGEVSPKVVTDFDINHPVSVAEIELDGFIAGSGGRLL